MTAERLLSRHDVMAQLGCGRTFVTEHCAELGGRKLGGLLRFRQADIDAFVARGRVAEDVQPAPKPARRLSVVGRGATNPRTGRPWDYMQESAR